MGLRNRGPTRLQQLELEHAQHDEGAMEDYRNSDALTADQSQMQKGYLVKILLAISSISLGTVASYWAFSPPAAIIGFINADIGKFNFLKTVPSSNIKLQVQVTMPVYLPSFGLLVLPSASSSLADFLTSLVEDTGLSELPSLASPEASSLLLLTT